MAKRLGVMNNVTDIKKRAKEIVPMSLFAASAMIFPEKISPVRAIMGTRHTSQRVVLTNFRFCLQVLRMNMVNVHRGI